MWRYVWEQISLILLFCLCEKRNEKRDSSYIAKSVSFKKFILTYLLNVAFSGKESTEINSKHVSCFIFLQNLLPDGGLRFHQYAEKSRDAIPSVNKDDSIFVGDDECGGVGGRRWGERRPTATA